MFVIIRKLYNKGQYTLTCNSASEYLGEIMGYLNMTTLFELLTEKINIYLAYKFFVSHQLRQVNL